MLVDELNKCISKSKDLRCGEYSFKLKLNPWQHPIFDKNIHHLLALLTLLRGGCGGVIYFLGDDEHTVTQESVELYKERLKTLADKKLECFPSSVNLVQMSLLLGMQRTWAALLLKKSYAIPRYPSAMVEGIWKPINFDIDMHGLIRSKSISETHSRDAEEIQIPLKGPSKRRIDTALLPMHINDDDAPQTDAVEETSSASGVQVPNIKSTDLLGSTTVDFSSCHKLDWSENKKDWEKYIKIKVVETNDIVASCPMWKPEHPMKITPDKGSLMYLFKSEEDMEETLFAVTTKGPGCAVVCRTWRFHITDVSETETRPPGHICDILTITETGRISFWVVVDSHDESNFEFQMEYLMTTGRMLKYQIIQKGAGNDLSNIWIECRLHALSMSTSVKNAVKLRMYESEGIQKHFYQPCEGGVNLAFLQRALAKLILCKESPLKRCVGDYASITLSEQQAEVLMHKAKVNYITGPAGSGKSWTAVCLYKMYGKENSVYICTTKEFLEYLKYNKCTGTLVLGDLDLLKEIRSGTFEKKICVIIDDCHNFMCTKASMKELFKLLKKYRDMSLFVFADHDYQSFDRKRQQIVHDCILHLTVDVFKQAPLNLPLTQIFRNTRKVVSFLHAAIQDVYVGHQNIESANAEYGKGVECIRMTNLWQESFNNDLVVYLRSLLLSEDYSQSEVAILLESSYTADEIERCKQLLAGYIPIASFQSADVFPRTGVIVDSVDSFLGLDANVCVFILSYTRKPHVHPLKRIFRQRNVESEKNIYNPRYEVFLASRAIHKAVFVVPQLHEELVQQMKFDDFQVCVRRNNIVFVSTFSSACIRVQFH